ncbi:MAG: beta strand repeat-containing protein [Planctomycetota bacterium]
MNSIRLAGPAQRRRHPWALALTVLLASSAAAFGQASTRGYTHDLRGNRTQATGQVRFSSAGAFHFEPNRVVPGDRVNIYGRNFPTAMPSQYSVSFAGMPGTIESVAERVITVVVPSSVGDGDVVLTLPNAQQFLVGSLHVQGILVTPSTIDLGYGQSQTFVAQVFGAPGGSVQWELEALVPGADPGTISATGVYVAPVAPNGAFPVLVKATSTVLGQTATALVTSSCSSVAALPVATLTPGIWTAAFERDCYDFPGASGQTVTVAYLGSAPAHRLRLLDASGLVLASAVDAANLCLPTVLLPETGMYRIEVEAGPAASGSYQVWRNEYTTQPAGLWVFPGSGSWTDAQNWSGGTVPGPGVAVTIPEYPGELTVTVTTGNSVCASVVSDENLRLQGGTLNVTGSLQVNGILTLAGGTLANATVLPGTGGEGLNATTSGGTLDGVTLASLATLGNDADMTVRNGLTFAGGSIQMTTNNNFTDITFNGTQTVGGNGEIIFNGSGNLVRNRLFTNVASTTVTFGPGVTLRGRQGLIGTGTGSFVNQGTMRSDTAGQTVQVTNLSNTGMLQAFGGTLDLNGVTGNLGTAQVNGGGVLDVDGNYTVNSALIVRDASTLTLRGTWVNAGGIAMTNSTVNLGGSFQQSSLASFTRSGGTVNLTGTIDVTGTTLAFNAASGSWMFVGGTVMGGTITMANGQSLIPTTTAGTLSGVTLAGVLAMPNDADITVTNGLTFAPGGGIQMTTSNNFTDITLNGSQTIGGTGEIVFDGTGTLVRNRLFTNVAATTITFGPGVTLRGRQGLIGTGTGNFVNEGTIRSDTAGQTVQVTNLTNTGTLQAFGGTLDLNGVTGNLGTAQVNGGGVLDVDGNYTVNSSLTIRDASTLTLRGTWVNAGGIAMTDSTVNLGGSFQHSSLASFTRSGGTVNLTGIIDVTGNTLAFNAATGSWLFVGGTVVGGTMTMANGQSLIPTTTAGTLSGVTLAGVFTMPNDGDITITNGLTFGAGGSIQMTTNNNFTDITFNGSQTIGGTGEFVFDGTGTLVRNRLFTNVAATTITFGPGVTLRGRQGLIGTGTGSFVNQGTIRSDTAGQTVQVTNLTNTGMLQAFGGTLDLNGVTGNLGTAQVNGGGVLDVDGNYTLNSSLTIRDASTLTLRGTWVNAGGIAMTDSTVNLGGSFQHSSLATFTRSGGTVNLTGTIDVTGNTLAFNAATGSWLFVGGTVVGGTITTANGESLIPTTTAGTLNGVTVAGVLAMPNDGDLTITNGLTFAAGGSIHMTTNNNFTDITFNGSQTVGGTGEFVFDGTGTLVRNRLFTNVAATTITFGPGVTLRGRQGQIGFGTGNFVNQGTIRSDTAGQTVQVTNLTNTGMLQAFGGTLDLNGVTGNLGTAQVNGGGVLDVDGTYTVNSSLTIRDASTLTLRGTWVNAGGIAMTDSTVNLGGTFQHSSLATFTRSGGTVNLTGTVDLTGNTLAFDAATGSWLFVGGTVLGGTMTMANGQSLIPTTTAGTLNGVTLAGALTMPNDGDLTITNGLTFAAGGSIHMTTNNNFTDITLNGSQTIGGSGEIVFDGSGTLNRNRLFTNVAATTITFGPGVTLRGRQGLIGTGTGSFVNQGTIRADVAGQTVQVANLTNTGMLQAFGGTLDLNGVTGNLGTAQVNGGGILDVDGTYTVNSSLTIRDASTLTLRGTWVNAGGIAMTDSTVNLGGTFQLSSLATFNRSGGTVNLTGTLDLGGNTLAFNAATGSWLLVGGTVAAGTITMANGQSLVPTTTAGTLSGVTLAGVLTMPNDGDIIVTNGLTFAPGGGLHMTTNNNFTDITLNGSQTIGGTGEIVFDGTGTLLRNRLFANATATVVTLGPGVTLRGRQGQVGTGTGTIVNQGTIRSETMGVSIGLSGVTNQGLVETANGGSFSSSTGWNNAGTVNVGPGGTWSSSANYVQTAGSTNLSAGATITAPTFELQGGVLSGSGTLSANLTNTGIVRPGGTGIGTLTVNGSFTQSASGALEIQLQGTGAGQFDVLAISTQGNYGGTLALSASGFAPALGNVFPVITHGSTSGTQFSAVTGGALGGGLALQPTYLASGVNVSVVNAP